MRHQQIFISLIIFALLVNFACSSSSGSFRGDKEKTENTALVSPEKIVRDLYSALDIRSVNKTEFIFDEQGKLSGYRKLSDAEFNKKGYQTGFITYDEDSFPEYTFTYEYNKDGRRLKSNCFMGQKLIRYYKYLYDDYGFRLKTECFNQDGFLIEYYIYEYDDEGRLINEKWFDKNGKIFQRVEYEYDGFKKNIIRTFDGNNDLIYRYEMKYDNNNLLIEELKFDDSGRNVGVIQYIYKYR